MLSEKKLCENEIYEICKSARDINLNECFRGVRILTPAIGSEHLRLYNKSWGNNKKSLQK